ncbi:MAG: hypothetical protein AAFP97_00270 [Pseudomonadota bacterium]
MRWIVQFLGYAIIFAGVTEAFDIFLDGESFDWVSATIKGVIFGGFMTGWAVWNERRKRERANGE